MRTTLSALVFIGLAGVCFFGYHALELMVVSVLAGLFTDMIANRIRQEHQPGSKTHSAIMGLLVAFTLPANTPIYVAMIGASVSVAVGKHFFGGLGHYVWHPALIGRLVVQLFFGKELSQSTGAILSREHIFFGDISNAVREMSWFNLDWLSTTCHDVAGFVAEQPAYMLRSLKSLTPINGSPDIGQYMLEHLPPLSNCLIGAVPGSLGETSALVIVVVGLYLAYRGYIHWQLPMLFIATALIATVLCPVMVDLGPSAERVAWFPALTADPLVAITYMTYQLLSGGLLLGAFVFMTDMTCRPITRQGQLLFAICAGVLTVIYRYYSSIEIPCYAAILTMNTFSPAIDRLTRPRGRKDKNRR